jgi:hypothetical protein
MSVEQRQQRQLDAERSLGVNRKSDEHQDDPAFVKKQVLSDLLAGGQVDPLPGTNLFYSWRGGDAASGGRMVFMNANGDEVSGSPSQQQAALADQASWTNSYNASQGLPPTQGAGAPGAASQQDFESYTNDFIRKLMSGEEGPYTDQVKAGMRSDSAKARSADVLNANRQATLSAARGGTSGTVSSILAANARSGREGVASDTQGINFQAATENAKSKIQGLQAAQDTIQRKYQDAWNKATDATQRAGIQKQFDAAMAKVNADTKIAMEQANSERASGAANRAFLTDQQQREWDREDKVYTRDLPTKTYQNAGLGG